MNKEKNAAATEELARRSQAGDLEAFGDLVRRHEGWVRGYFRARTNDWTGAEDLAQDVFVTAFRRIRGFRGDAGFETWLRGIARNHLRNFIRKRRDLHVCGSEELQTLLEQSCDEFAEGRDDRRALEVLHQCLKRIDGPARGLLDARYAAGKTVREISKETGRGYSALTMQLHRLRQKLADCVKAALAIPEA